MDYPKIRYIEAHPIQHEGKELVILNDAEGIMENSLIVSKDLVFLLSLMDGTRSLRDIQAEYMKAFGELLYIEHIQKLVEDMDKNLLLLSENFKQHLAGLKETYENDPVRMPFHAGKSYQANRMELLSFLDEMFRTEKKETPYGRITGVLAPHIDYERGAEVYCDTYNSLKGQGKSLLIILGTSHYSTEKIWNISLKSFSTPLDVIPNSEDFCTLIKDNDVLKNYINEWPHRNEHSIELQLPLLQFVIQDDFEILPILTGSLYEYMKGDRDIETDRELKDIIDNFKSVLTRYGKPYIIISAADLAHIGAQFGDKYSLDALTLGQSSAKDEELLRCIGNVDADGFFKTIQNEGDRRRICGLTPIYFQLKLLEGSMGKIVSYKQWTDGQSSVSFAGGLFYDKQT
ncbi:MAG: AmmeMemoRadiSam system protein B [Proteobacteria bacterium]|nr:AmmeMemoRadiSam system protein B [Pseudomonadota bacterium]